MVTILQDLRQVTYFNNMASAIDRKAQQKSKDFSIESMSLVRSPMQKQGDQAVWQLNRFFAEPVWQALRGEGSKPGRAWRGGIPVPLAVRNQFSRPSVVASLRFGQQLLSVPLVPPTFECQNRFLVIAASHLAN